MGGRSKTRRSPGMRGMKRLHLVTDAGFLRSTLLWLALEAALLGCAWSHAPLRFWAIDLYEEVKLKMLGFAHHMAWWSLLGLLSSACCVLQIILNLFSFGCAGFNTLLGPVRPPLIALTGIAQAVSWYVAYPLPFQWAPTAATTALSLLLTFSPELLYLTQQRRGATAPDAASAGGEDAALRDDPAVAAPFTSLCPRVAWGRCGSCTLCGAGRL